MQTILINKMEVAKNDNFLSGIDHSHGSLCLEGRYAWVGACQGGEGVLRDSREHGVLSFNF